MLTILPALSANAVAANLQEPPVLKSSGGVLDVLMIARPNTTPILGLGAPVGWLYDICPNPGPGILACPPGPQRSQAYGGTRLSLQPGDTLKVRLVNKLPPYAHGESKHALEPGHDDLALNPTNIHTHGLIVEPRRPTLLNPTWGDNIFVQAFNPVNGTPGQSAVNTAMMAHGQLTNQPVDYQIRIPANHPSGSYWFHSHIHGVAYNQVTAGLAGIISIGQSGDYACEDFGCAARWSETNVRHLILKDIMVDNVSTAPKMLTQPQPTFCSALPDGSNPNEPANSPRKGSCPGQDITTSYGADPNNPPGTVDGSNDPLVTGVITNHNDGRWIFSVNGQVYPTIPVTAPQGEIWRITNESGSNAYDLHLQDDANNDMIMQVVSVDGVAISADAVVTGTQMSQIGGAKVRFASCPLTKATPAGVAPPACATSFRMYPSSRIEIMVAYRDATGKLVTPPTGAHATFKSVGLNTGVAGDGWPSVDLADVKFLHGARPAGLPEFVNVKGHVKPAFSAGGVFVNAIQQSLQPAPVLTQGTTCAALPTGWKRRIYYGLPAANDSAFGLAYELVDDTGAVRGTSASDVYQFDPTTPTICLPLGKGNVPVKETWELVNLAGEDHNFHIHQTKFRVVGAPTTLKKGINPPQLPFPGNTVLHDNIPLPSATDLIGDGSGCGGFAEFQAGTCTPTKLTVEIAFSQVGEFVYHCHILEHEDGGMMSKIVVTKGP